MLRRLARLATPLLLGAALTLLPAAPGSGAETTCATSGPSWTVTVCLTVPAGPLSGDAPVSATVTRGAGAPAVTFAEFDLGGDRLITDWEAPYAFALPTGQYADGTREVAVTARTGDGWTSAPAAAPVTFANGHATVPLNPGTFAPRGRAPAAGEPLVVAATGDAAGGRAAASAVSDLLVSWDPDAMLYLGDVYEEGTRTEYHNWYGDDGRLFGRLRGVTNPTPGNHEADHDGYPYYWDNAPHWYSWDAGGWHFVSLDSTTQLGQVAPGTPQFEWLRDNLATSASACTLVFFHHPRWSVGDHGSEARMDDVWRLLAGAGVDLVLNGHDHNYQRWQPLDAAGAVAADGPTQLVLGGGGHGISRFDSTDPRLAVGYDTAPTAFGALRLELTPSRADFRYVNTAGQTLDSGAVTCGAAPPPPSDVLFADDFESGSLSGWTYVNGLAVQQADRYAGSWAARAVSTNGVATYARRTVASRREVYLRARVKVRAQGATIACLLKVRTSTAVVVDVCLDPGGRVYSWNYVTRTKTAAAATITPGVWREVQVRALVDGAASRVDVWLDGVPLPELSGPRTLGSALLAGVQVGGNETGKSYDVVFDDVVASAAYVGADPPAPDPDPSPSPSPTTSPAPSPSPSASAAPSPSPSPSPTGDPTPSPSPTGLPPGTVFADGFESGDLSAWSSVNGLAVQQAERWAGSWAARATSGSGGVATYARRTLAAPAADVTFTTRVLVVAQGPTIACLLKFRTAGGATVVDLCLDADGELYTWNYGRRTKRSSAVSPTRGVWHEVSMRVVVAGAESRTDVYVDGVPVAGVTGPDDIGTAAIGGVQLGGNETGKSYDLVFDDVRVTVPPG